MVVNRMYIFYKYNNYAAATSQHFIRSKMCSKMFGQFLHSLDNVFIYAQGLFTLSTYLYHALIHSPKFTANCTNSSGKYEDGKEIVKLKYYELV